LIFSIFGLGLLNICNDFLLFYLAIELQSLAFYVLATFKRNSEYSIEAGLKYFVLGAFSSGLLLFGFSSIFIGYGTVSFETITQISSNSNKAIGLLGSFFIFVTFCFKIGTFPFHMWVCDVYEGALISITMFFSAVPKIVIFGVLIKICIVLIQFIDFFEILLILSGLGSICFASVLALYQKRLKRLLAYSAISHSGFILLGIFCLTLYSLRSVIIYIMIYAIMTLAIFSLVLLSNINNKAPKFLIN
jgi:NADH-quinone oxidoreductase subunit N